MLHTGARSLGAAAEDPNALAARMSAVGDMSDCVEHALVGRVGGRLASECEREVRRPDEHAVERRDGENRIEIVQPGSGFDHRERDDQLRRAIAIDEVADLVAAAMPPGSPSDRPGAEGLKRLLEGRGVMLTDYDDWRKIEETEVANARPGSPREKFVRHEEWIATLRR